MTSSPEAPALVLYACERCGTRFAPPSRLRVGFGGKLRAVAQGLGRGIRFKEGFGAAGLEQLEKMDDEAYQSFVQGFRFCQQCRQFVCSECWSAFRRSCLTCLAKSAPSPVRPRPALLTERRRDTAAGRGLRTGGARRPASPEPEVRGTRRRRGLSTPGT